MSSYVRSQLIRPPPGYSDPLKRFRSAVEYALDGYRRQLTVCMMRFDMMSQSAGASHLGDRLCYLFSTSYLTQYPLNVHHRPRL